MCSIYVDRSLNVKTVMTTPHEETGPVVTAAAGLLAAAQTFAHLVSGSTGPVPAGSGDALATVRAARDLRRAADDALAAAVTGARGRGATWAEIGTVLGTSRQAAFQRFSPPRAAGADAAPVAAPRPGAADAAIDVLAAFFAGDLTRVGRDFTAAMAELDHGRLSAVRDQVTATVGSLQALGEPFVRRTGALTVVDVPVRCEAGDLTGRLAFTDDGGITGLFLLPDAVPGV